MGPYQIGGIATVGAPGHCEGHHDHTHTRQGRNQWALCRERRGGGQAAYGRGRRRGRWARRCRARGARGARAPRGGAAPAGRPASCISAATATAAPRPWLPWIVSGEWGLVSEPPLLKFYFRPIRGVNDNVTHTTCLVCAFKSHFL
jgi:hypothetical protein